MKFDTLHRLDDYYEPMALSVDSKAKRRELAELLTDAFLYFFSVFEVHSLYKSLLERAMYEQLLVDKISDAVSKVTGIDSEMSGHIRTLSKQVVDTTYKNVQENPDTQIRQNSPYQENLNSASFDHNEPLDSPKTSSSGSLLREDEKNYWLSFERAQSIAYTEANTFFNYTDYVDAKEKGLKTKTWRTMLDPKVRDTHEEIEGRTIGIDELFNVGDSLMRFPHDWQYAPNASETVNCRCAIEYK